MGTLTGDTERIRDVFPGAEAEEPTRECVGAPVSTGVAEQSAPAPNTDPFACWPSLHDGYPHLDRTLRSGVIRQDVNAWLSKLGWAHNTEWQWVKERERWTLELSVVCAAPHQPIIERTGLSHPIMIDHGKVQRGAQWATKSMGSLRTYLFVLARDPAALLSEQNGVYRLDHPAMVRLYGKPHTCDRACVMGPRDLMWHVDVSQLRRVQQWTELGSR